MFTRFCRAMMLFAILTVPACQSTQQESAGLSSSDRIAIEQIALSVADAELVEDWETAAAALATDAILMPPGESVMIGRDAWLAEMRRLQMSIEEMSYTIEEIEGRGDLAYVRITIRYLVLRVLTPARARGCGLCTRKRTAPGAWQS